jgi:hypothetical protein
LVSKKRGKKKEKGKELKSILFHVSSTCTCAHEVVRNVSKRCVEKEGNRDIYTFRAAARCRKERRASVTAAERGSRKEQKYERGEREKQRGEDVCRSSVRGFFFSPLSTFFFICNFSAGPPRRGLRVFVSCDTPIKKPYERNVNYMSYMKKKPNYAIVRKQKRH